MSPVSRRDKQDNLLTIDNLAEQAEALLARMKDGGKIRSRELREIWNARLRPVWRLHLPLYQTVVKHFVNEGDNFIAIEVADEGSEFFGDDPTLILQRALATARSGAPRAAQDLLTEKHHLLRETAEVRSLQARTYKDLWKSSGNVEYLKEAFRLYFEDYQKSKGGDCTFPGVNAASMSLLLGDRVRAGVIADNVLKILSAGGKSRDYWMQVTVGECLLIKGRVEEARAVYALASAEDKIPPAQLAVTRAQARLLLLHLGQDERTLDPCFPLLNVLAFTGHRVDANSREVPRFPSELADDVKTRIRAAVRAAGAGFGYSAAANGGDILFLEVMQEEGLETYIHLPLPIPEFIRCSVDHESEPAWVERFWKVIAAATELVVEPEEQPLAFEYGNRLLFGAACQHASQLGSDVRLLALWDRGPGDGAGGAADFVEMVDKFGYPTEIVEVGQAAGPRPRAVAPSTERSYQLLSVLSFSLPPGNGFESKVASLKEEFAIIHCEVMEDRVRFYFDRPEAAGEFALSLSEETGLPLGLHAGPMAIMTHPLTGNRVIRGSHALKADNFSVLNGARAVYASRAFAALISLVHASEARCEFVGYAQLENRIGREAIFSLISSSRRLKLATM